MYARMSEARRGAFLAALLDTGNQTLAAERSGVSRSWVCKARSLDAAFDADVRRAVAAARERLARAPEAAPPAGGETHLGAELIVRGTGGRRTQVARARRDQWNARRERLFMAELSMTNNVRMACVAAAIGIPAAYAHRTRRAGFAGRWAEGRVDGAGRVACMIVFGREAAGLPPEPPIPVTPVPPMSVDQALHLLWTNRNAVRGVGRPAGRTARIRSLEEMRPQILRKFNTWIAARRWLDGRRAEPARQGNVAPESKQTDAGAGDSPAAVAVSRSRA